MILVRPGRATPNSYTLHWQGHTQLIYFALRGLADLPLLTLEAAGASYTAIHVGGTLDWISHLKPLLPFENRLTGAIQSGILFGFREYLALLDWTGRIIRDDKRGYIDTTLPPLLDRLEITADQWRMNTTQFEALHPKRFNRIIPQLDTG